VIAPSSMVISSVAICFIHEKQCCPHPPKPVRYLGWLVRLPRLQATFREIRPISPQRFIYACICDIVALRFRRIRELTARPRSIITEWIDGRESLAAPNAVTFCPCFLASLRARCIADRGGRFGDPNSALRTKDWNGRWAFANPCQERLIQYALQPERLVCHQWLPR
jgi:hypothetical protein